MRDAVFLVLTICNPFACREANIPVPVDLEVCSAAAGLQAQVYAARFLQPGEHLRHWICLKGQSI